MGRLAGRQLHNQRCTALQMLADKFGQLCIRKCFLGERSSKLLLYCATGQLRLRALYAIVFAGFGAHQCLQHSGVVILARARFSRWQHKRRPSPANPLALRFSVGTWVHVGVSDVRDYWEIGAAVLLAAHYCQWNGSAYLRQRHTDRFQRISACNRDNIWYVKAAAQALHALLTVCYAGTTLTSPTIYISYDLLYASDSCSGIGKTYVKLMGRTLRHVLDTC